VTPLVPSFRAEFQGFVIPMQVLLDEPLEADVAPNLVSQVIVLEKKQQASYATVSVPERMDTEEIQAERR
jgi:hypothetical protein